MVLRKPYSEFIDFMSAIFVVKFYFEKTHLRKAQNYLDGRERFIRCARLYCHERSWAAADLVCAATSVHEQQQICIAQHCQYPAVTREFCLWPRGKCFSRVVLPAEYLRTFTTAVLIALPTIARRRQNLLHFINNCLVVYISTIDTEILFRKIYMTGRIWEMVNNWKLTSFKNRTFTKWKLQVNNHKTQAILFTKRRPTAPEPLRFNHSTINWSSQVRYLGLILGSKLLFAKHITSVSHRVSGTPSICFLY